MAKFNTLKTVKNLFGDLADGAILGLCALALSLGFAGFAVADGTTTADSCYKIFVMGDWTSCGGKCTDKTKACKKLFTQTTNPDGSVTYTPVACGCA